MSLYNAKEAQSLPTSRTPYSYTPIVQHRIKATNGLISKPLIVTWRALISKLREHIVKKRLQISGSKFRATISALLCHLVRTTI